MPTQVFARDGPQLPNQQGTRDFWVEVCKLLQFRLWIQFGWDIKSL